MISHYLLRCAANYCMHPLNALVQVSSANVRTHTRRKFWTRLHGGLFVAAMAAIGISDSTVGVQTSKVETRLRFSLLRLPFSAGALLSSDRVSLYTTRSYYHLIPTTTSRGRFPLSGLRALLSFLYSRSRTPHSQRTE